MYIRCYLKNIKFLIIKQREPKNKHKRSLKLHKRNFRIVRGYPPHISTTVDDLLSRRTIQIMIYRSHFSNDNEIISIE